MKRKRALLVLVAGLCIALQPVAHAALPTVDLDLVAEGCNAPIFLVAPNDGTGRRFVGEQIGLVFALDADGVQRATPFLDLRDSRFS
ncbi:MAG: hypothetical protein OET44_15915 [Gammaproteobacteria bacterium]|nr:hypothetical protein [Gammaproteobacteria bacterium]